MEIADNVTIYAFVAITFLKQQLKNNKKLILVNKPQTKGLKFFQ